MPEREADLQAPLEARDHAISLAGEGALVVAVFEDQPRRSQSSDVVERIVKRGEPRSLFSRRSHFEAAGRSGPGPAVAAEPTATRTASQTTSDPLWRVGGSRRSGLQHPPRPAVPVRRLGRCPTESPSPPPTTSPRACLCAARMEAGRLDVITVDGAGCERMHEGVPRVPRLHPECEALLWAAVILASDPHIVGLGIPLKRHRQLIGMPLVEFSKHLRSPRGVRAALSRSTPAQPRRTPQVPLPR